MLKFIFVDEQIVYKYMPVFASAISFLFTVILFIFLFMFTSHWA